MGLIFMKNQTLTTQQEPQSLVIIEDQKAVEDFLRAIDSGKMDVFTALDKATEISDLIKSKIEKWDKEADEKKKAIEEKASRSAKIGHKKDAIMGLQEVTKEIYSFQEDFVAAQKLSFANQAALGFISDALFRLGTMNQSNYDSMVKKITMMLSDASQEELDEFSRRQLMKTLTDLKNQESMQKKYRTLSNEVHEQHERLNAQDDINVNIDQQLTEIEEQNLLQDDLIKQNKYNLAKQADKDIEHDKKIEEIVHIDETQDEKISLNADKISEHDQVLEVQKSKDDEHDLKLQAMDEEDEKHNKLIAENALGIERLESLIEKYNDEQVKVNSEFNKMITELAQKSDDEILNLRSDFETQILNLRSDIEKQQNSLSEEIAQIKERLGLIDSKMSKMFWKISVSVVAVSSLLLNILLILGIL